MANGYCCDLHIGDVVSTQPGNMSGPFKKAIDDRFTADVIKSVGICYDDYVASGGNGKRVIYVPIVSTIPNGTGPVTINGFAAFFISTKPGNGVNSTLDGEFIYSVIPGSGGGTGGGAVAFSVHLVPNP